MTTHVQTSLVQHQADRGGNSVHASLCGFAPEVTIRAERAEDAPEREALLDTSMGESRRKKSSEKLRRHRLPADGLALVAENGQGRVVGSVRLWHVLAGSVPALLLGPLAVARDMQGEGIGGRLMRRAIAEARFLGHGAILLVGDAPYYGRFGFSAGQAQGITMPGPVDPARFLALELQPGSLDGAKGPLVAAGRFAPRNGRPALDRAA